MTALERPQTSPDVAPTAAEITALLRARFQAADFKPPMLPVVAMELLELSQRPGVELDHVVAVLERDPMLAGRVLRLVQSPVYASRSPVRSLKQAVVRLGLAKLRDVVLEVAMNLRIFRAGAYTEWLEKLRKHSTATAYLARIVCYYTAMEGEYAFLCGLLHDVGIAASLLVLGERPENANSDPEAVWESLNAIHEEAGGLLARLWKLPEDIQKVIANHHKVEVDGEPHPLIATLVIAQRLAEDLDAGMPDRDTDETWARAKDILNISDSMLDQIRNEGRELLAKLGAGGE